MGFHNFLSFDQDQKKLLVVNFFFIFFTICWYGPADQPPPKLAEANKILANDEFGQVVIKTNRSDKTEIKKF